GFFPVMKPVHETLEMVGMDDRIGAIVPVAPRRASVGVTPRAMRSCTSGSPTPSSPRTATFVGRSSARAPPPRRSLSSPPTPPPHLYLRDPDALGDGRVAVAHVAPAVLAQRAHALLHRRVLDQPRRRTLQDQPLDRIGDRQELVDAGAAPVPGVGTLLAADAL